MRIALVWHGDRAARDSATLEAGRFAPLADTLRAVGVEPVPAVYNDDFAGEVQEQLLGMDGVLVWVNPIENGRDRARLDAMLLGVAAQGVFVSAHPEIIVKMGTKEVLYRTRGMGWGSDTYLYATIEELRAQLPLRLADGGARVLKQRRGNGGDGVWKVERHPDDSTRVRVRHALRGSAEQDLLLDAFLAQCERYFAGGGKIIDQPYQTRLPEGMVRCYLCQDRIVGFGRQEIVALHPTESPGPRLYHPPTAPQFRAIRAKMETDWLSALCRTLDMAPDSLPMLWDADLLYGPKDDAGEDTYVLCEINVSAVYPFPDSALEPLAEAVKEWVTA